MFKRHHDDHELTDEEEDLAIDPELRLRTVRTAASTLTESAAVEQRAGRRRMQMLNKSKKGSFFRRTADKKRATSQSAAPVSDAGPSVPSGPRRNIYVNCPLASTEADVHGEPIARYPRNKVRSTSKSLRIDLSQC